MKPCPGGDVLARFVDGSLPVDESERIRAHVARCPRCRAQEEAGRSLIADVRAPIAPALDVEAHARAVMDRLDRPVAPSQNPWLGWGLVGSLAAGAIAGLAYLGGRAPAGPDAWQARGGSGGETATIARDVGVQPYAVLGGLRPLVPGIVLDGATPLTAGYRNLGPTPAYLLLFAVDAQRTVHWISPKYAQIDDDPASTPLETTTAERLLDTTAVLEDVAAGPLRVVAVMTAKPAHVSEVESLHGADLDAAGLLRKLPRAEVREIEVEVRPLGEESR